MDGPLARKPYPNTLTRLVGTADGHVSRTLGAPDVIRFGPAARDPPARFWTGSSAGGAEGKLDDLPRHAVFADRDRVTRLRLAAQHREGDRAVEGRDAHRPE